MRAVLHRAAIVVTAARQGRTVRRVTVVAAVCAAAIGLSLVAPGVALASELSVTNCSGDPTVSGSLPNVVANASAGDDINFETSCSVITLTDALTIAKDLNFNGPGIGPSLTLTGGGPSGVVDITSGTTHITSLTINNGTAAGITVASGAGLTLDRGTVSGNAGAGIDADGGTVNVLDSTVSGNNGSGILSDAGGLRVENSTVSGNTAAGDGGGIDTIGGATVIVENSTVSGNTAAGNGGGIANGDASGTNPSSSVAVVDSTVAGNTASGNGGGIDNEGGTVQLILSTVAGSNTALGNGGGINNENTVYNSLPSPGTVYAGGAIVADNNLGGPDSDHNKGPNCAGGGMYTSLGDNLTNDSVPGGATATGCGFMPSPGGTDVVGAEPLLGPLTDNGGTTLTMLPPLDSPAVAAIPAGTFSGGFLLCGRGDQRDLESADGAPCTIGAVEVSTITVNVSGSQVPGSSTAAFTETDNAPSGAAVDDSNLTCTTAAGGTALNLLPTGTYTLDASSCSGAAAFSDSGGVYQIAYTAAPGGFIVAQAPTSTAVSSSAQSSLFGKPVTFTATVTPTGSGTPTGTVTFSDSSTTTPLCNAVSLNNGTATCTATALAPGSHTITAAYSGDGNFTGSSGQLTQTVGFSPATCITKSFTGPLVIGNGQAYCIAAGAVITSGVTIKPGGALYLTGGTIKGSLNATSPSAITLCGASVSGSVTITGATGPLAIGGPLGTGTCAKNTNMIAGNVSLTGNQGGLTYQNNIVNGSLTITNNPGGIHIGLGNKTTGKSIIKP